MNDKSIIGYGVPAYTGSAGTSSSATVSGNIKVASAKKKESGHSKGTSLKTTSDLHLRANAGKDNNSLKVMPKGEKVTWYGYYNVNKEDGVNWYLVVDSKGTTGYASSKYLEKA